MSLALMPVSKLTTILSVRFFGAFHRYSSIDDETHFVTLRRVKFLIEIPLVERIQTIIDPGFLFAHA